MPSLGPPTFTGHAVCTACLSVVAPHEATWTCLVPGCERGPTSFGNYGWARACPAHPRQPMIPACPGCHAAFRGCPAPLGRAVGMVGLAEAGKRTVARNVLLAWRRWALAGRGPYPYIPDPDLRHQLGVGPAPSSSPAPRPVDHPLSVRIEAGGAYLWLATEHLPAKHHSIIPMAECVVLVIDPRSLAKYSRFWDQATVMSATELIARVVDRTRPRLPERPRVAVVLSKGDVLRKLFDPLGTPEDVFEELADNYTLRLAQQYLSASFFITDLAGGDASGAEALARWIGLAGPPAATQARTTAEAHVL